jgi:hypothetical protein
MKFKIISSALIFLFTLISVALLWEYPLILTTILILLSIILLTIVRARLIKNYFTCAFLGAFSEIIAIRANTWEYNSHQFLGIPIWLPVLWGIAGVCFVFIARFYNEVVIK